MLIYSNEICSTLNYVTIYQDWPGNTGFTISEIRFYYDPGDSFTITPSKATLIVGDTDNLTPPDGVSVTSWESGNTSVATVDNDGKVTAVSAGSATITAKATIDGVEKTGTCQITVEEFAITSNKELNLGVGETGTFTSNASADWSITDSDKVERSVSDDGKTFTVKPKAAGSFTVTATKGNRTDTATIVAAKKPIVHTYTFTIDNANDGNDTTFNNNGTGWDNVTKIEISANDYNGSYGTNLYYTINGERFRGSALVDYNESWIQSDQNSKLRPTFETISSRIFENVHLDSVDFLGSKTWSGQRTITIKVTCAPVEEFIITPNKTSGYQGDTITFTVSDSNGVINWNNPDIKNIGDNTYSLIVKEHENITIRGTDADGKIGSCTINVNPIQISPNPIQLHVKTEGMPETVGTREITPTPPLDDITFEISDSSIALIEGKTITAQKAGDTTLTMTRNGVTLAETVPVNVLEPLTITGLSDMNPSRTQTLTVQNNIDNVTWSIVGEAEARIDENTGVLTSSGTEETVTVRATDIDGSTAEFAVNIHSVAFIPELPDDKFEVGIYELTKEKGWKETVPNLPVVDENGRPYYYYIVEVDENGNELTTASHIKGNGAIYIPTGYDGNGSQLSEDNPTNLSVTNKKIGETQGELPSAGGEGTAKYYVTGMMIICSAAAYYLIRRRKRNAVK